MRHNIIGLEDKEVIPMIGETVRDYRFVDLLGTGGFGAIYRAQDLNVKREVAIKLILPEHAQKPEFAQRFATEAQLVAQLEHPHIIPLYAYWQDERGAFLVMRLIRGGNLRERLNAQGALSLAECERLLSQIAAALKVAHQAQVVHRDIKPENILLDDMGNAYLGDFGIAKQINEAPRLTVTDGIMGSWKYLSPEQIQNEAVSPQSDIYALGIMLYEMLVGKHPYPDASVGALVMKHMQEPLPDISLERPDLPSALNAILQKASAKDPNQRYASVEAFLADFLALKAPEIPKTEKPKVERNRQAMLENVTSFWIEGVLEQSLYQAVFLELGMQPKTNYVDNAWQSILKMPDMPEERFEAGTEIIDVYERLKGKMLILGEPGSGKTTTLLSLARDLLNRAEWDEAHPIPVVFNLSTWAENRKALGAWMLDELHTKYQVPRKIGQGWIDAEQILPLLDGLDEVALEARNDCVEMLNAFRAEHGFVDMVVCSRIADYEALQGRLRLNGAIVLEALEREQVNEYLAALGDDGASVALILDEDEKLRRLTTSPLMLNIIVLAYRGVSINEIPEFDSIEARRKHLFETYVKRVLERKGENQPYPPEKTVRWLSKLARVMHEDEQSVFYIAATGYNWLETWNDKATSLLTIPFPFIYSGNLLATIAADLVLISLCIGLYKLHPWLVGTFLGLLSLGILFTSSLMISNRTKFLVFFELTFSLDNLRTQKHSVKKGTIVNICSTPIVFGIIVPMIFKIFSADIANMSLLRIILLFSPFTILIFLFFELMIVLQGFFKTVARVPSRKELAALSRATHIQSSLKAALWLRGYIPWDYPKFLNYAVDRILLRRAGGGYIFIHRLLLDYFANLESKAEDPERISRLSLAASNEMDDEDDELHQIAKG